MNEEPKSFHSPLIRKILKEMSLRDRIKIYLEMEYLMINGPDHHPTDQEYKDAHVWADKVTTDLLVEINEWEADGRPKDVG